MTWYLLQVKTVHSFYNSADTQLILSRGNVIMILSHEYMLQGYNMVKLIPFNFLVDLVVLALVQPFLVFHCGGLELLIVSSWN